MAVELKVPEMGESVSEVYIGKWYKSEGDEVEADDPLVELESEKATLDLRAPSRGVLGQILKKTGDTAEVGEVIGALEDGAAKPAKTASKQEESKQAPRTSDKQEDTTAQKTERAERASKDNGRPAASEQEQTDADRSTQLESKPREKSEKNEQERSTKVAQREQPERKQESEATSTRTSGAREERVLMSPVRRRIALRLVEAQANAALLTTFNEIDMSAVKSLRSEFGEAFERRHGVRLGFMSFFVKATVEALRDCPELNAFIEDEEIIYRNYYDIGVAISTDRGLVVPVLRDAARMNFASIESAINTFAERARAGQLTVDELQGGTFTITNGGVFGSLLSTPIVNPPQSGVLGMHAIQDRPVAVDGQVVIRPMMYVALTYDHRLVDGREAVTFLRRIKETIENPARMLVEV